MGPVKQNPPHVLLVEDQPAIQFVHKEMLIKLGCKVNVASNGEQALVMATEHEYDLILLDIGLPDISGIEVACKLRARNLTRSARIIAITAHLDPTLTPKCFDAGIEQVLIKPVDMDKLKSFVLKK